MLPERSRMDSSVVFAKDGTLKVVENRNLKKGDRVILGRTEKGEEGIYLHTRGFEDPEETEKDQFVFRQGRSRETSYARDYDRFLSCSIMKESMEISSGSWDRPLPLTPTPEGLWRLWWKTATWMVLWQGMPWLPTT